MLAFSTQHKNWLPSLVFSSSGRDKSKGAGCGSLSFLRSLLAAAGIASLAASTASAQQLPEYWLATPPSVVEPSLHPQPPPELPNVPFAATYNSPLNATVKID